MFANFRERNKLLIRLCFILFLLPVFTAIIGCPRDCSNSIVGPEDVKHTAPLYYLSKSEQESTCSVLIKEISTGEFDANLFGSILEGAWSDECLKKARRTALNSPDEYAQRWAVRELIRHPNPEFKDRLQTLLNSVKEYRDEILLLGALTSIGSTESKEKLKMLLRSSNENIRFEALKAVELLPTADFTEEIIVCLKDSASYIRGKAIEILQQRKGCQAEGDILMMLKDSDSSVRTTVIQSLGPCSGTVVTEMIAECMTDTVSWVAGRAIYWRLKAGDERGVQAFIKSLPHSAVYIKWNEIIPVLKQFKSTLAEPMNKLIRYETENRWMMDMDMLNALRSAGYQIPDLEGIVLKKLSAKSTAACRNAGLLNLKTLAKNIRPLLKDRSHDVRAEAARALGMLRDQDSQQELEKLALSEYITRIQAMAARSLGQLGNTSSRTVLKKLLDDPSPWVRAEAAISLMELGDCSAVQFWLEGLTYWKVSMQLAPWHKESRLFDRRLCLKEVFQHLKNPKREVRVGGLKFLAEALRTNKE